MKQRRRIRIAVAAIVMALVSASCLAGPVNNGAGIGLSTGFDVSAVGYERSEFFMVQGAKSYSSAVPLTADGLWTVTADTATKMFATRLVVYRPSNPADFNGTVIVEWLNVTAGADLANDWVMAHNQYVRDGYAWVGVSAQAVGVNAVKTLDPVRYAPLVHPGDSYSYDIFTHAGKDIRTDPNVLGGLPIERLIATGESQSASRLVTYINAIHPIEGVYDGFMVHSRGSSGSSLRQAPLGSITTPRPTLIRNDLDVPVIVVQSEDDVIRSQAEIRQPNTPLFRLWEMAGTSHADSYTVGVGFNDIGDGAGTTAMFNRMITPQSAGCAKPINAGPHWLILQSAFAGLDHWIRTGEPPAVGPYLQTSSTTPIELLRDTHGNALGGIRTPQVDVPIARIDGLNTGPAFCGLFGSTTPFTPATLAALYPTHAAFVDAWTDSVNATIDAGFILPEDGPSLIAAAANSTIGE